MRLCNFTNKDIFRSNFKLIILVTAVSITTLFSVVDQTGWAALIYCPVGAALCKGTEGDDIIYGSLGVGVIRGLGGNDYIVGHYHTNVTIYGGDGNDTMIGGNRNDVLFGGNGNDRYDGLAGNDTIYETPQVNGSLVNNNDIISGGLGDDDISSGEGSDRIEGGQGNDNISPSPDYRDFSPDYVSCGSGNDAVFSFYSGDNDTALNCEYINNPDK